MVKLRAVLFIICFALSTGWAAGNADLPQKADDVEAVRIYLPREVFIQGQEISLSQIGVVRGKKSMVNQAGAVTMGRFSLAGQKVVIDRQTILSLLASEGIDKELVKFSGSEKVTIRRNEKVISGKRIAKFAKNYIEQLRNPKKSNGKFIIVREPKDFVLSDDSADIQLKANMSRYSNSRRVRVWVGIYCNGVEIDGREVIFDARYEQRRAVAAVNIPQGAKLTPNNIAIEIVQADEPADAKWLAPYGMVATRNIVPGRVIDSKVASMPEPPVIIERRQNVLMKIETGSLYISAQGIAMQDGAEGDIIKVKNQNANGRCVMCRVLSDGSVEPLF
jgi:flagella basal body P-ring formation protein FlgA